MTGYMNVADGRNDSGNPSASTANKPIMLWYVTLDFLKVKPLRKQVGSCWSMTDHDERVSWLSNTAASKDALED